MRYELFDYQEEAVSSIVSKIKARQQFFGGDYPEYSAIVLAAPTGAGKTVVATAMLEHLLDSSDIIEPSHNRTVLWVTDDPSLNAQTLLKLQLASDRWIKTEMIVSGSFDQEILDPGSLYFMNTQAASSTARLASASDTQRYTIWETLANTVRKYGSDFIVVIDEAHRGTQLKRDTPTVVSKIIDGTEEYGNERVPIVVGISATADKFTRAMKLNFSKHASARTVVSVPIPVEDVKESGIIKDRVVLYSPHEAGDVEADTTLLRDAVKRVKDFSRRWKAYCEAENEERVVKPVLVVQVENNVTDARLSELAGVIIDEWQGITVRNMVNTFGEHTHRDLTVGSVAYLEPHLIEGQSDVRVVFAKDAVTTGWDCQRAEVLISFRRAQDATYIAQLIGRIVRQPLARRIVADEALNSVYCALPFFDGKQVDAVANLFNDGNETVATTIVRGTISNTWNPDLFETLDVADEFEAEEEEMARAHREGTGTAAPQPAPVAKPKPTPAPVPKPASSGTTESTSSTEADVESTAALAQPSGGTAPVSTQPQSSSPDRPVAPAAEPVTISEEEFLNDGAGQQTAAATAKKKPSGPRKPQAVKVLEALPTYSIPNRKPKSSHIARLNKLASLLSLHTIYPEAKEEANGLLCSHLDHIATMRAEELTQRIAAISHVVIGSKVFTTDGTEIVTEGGAPLVRSAKLDKNNVNDLFRETQRTKLRDGLANVYWKHCIEDEDAADVFEAKIKVAAIGSMDGVSASMEARAEQIVDDWLKKYKLKISERHESQQADYKKLRGESRQPQEATLTIPVSIDTDAIGDDDGEDMLDAIRSDASSRYPKHLFADPGVKDGTFYAKLSPWEDKILRSQIAPGDVVAWYRNPPRGGEKSLCIPYETTKDGKTSYAGLYPDFILLRKEEQKLWPVIIDPHGEHLPDSRDKLRGLVKYAEEHGAAFKAIYPIVQDPASKKDLALPLHSAETRGDVLAELDAGVDLMEIYRKHGGEI